MNFSTFAIVALSILSAESNAYKTPKLRVADQTTPSVSPAQAILNDLEACLKGCPYDVKGNGKDVSDDLDACVQGCNEAATVDATSRSAAVPGSVGTTIIPCVDKCSDDASKDYENDLDDNEDDETDCKNSCASLPVPADSTTDTIGDCEKDCEHDRNQADNKSKKDFEKDTDDCYAKCFEPATVSSAKVSIM